VRRESKIVIAVVAAIALTCAGAYGVLTSSVPSHPATEEIQVVAAENFWGSLIAQLGGTHVHVSSIVSDPNADPHEYEVNTTDARLIADAQLVVQNGAGYDDWCSQLIAASATPHQVVLNVAQDLGVPSGGNPHVWYSPVDVNLTVHAMYSALVTISPADATYFQQQYAALNVSLGELYGRASAIRAQFAGTEVAATEDLFVYLANFTRLDLVSPPEFMAAVAEGNDPPAQSVVTFQQQLESGNVSVLVYNAQTVTPITSQMEQVALQHNVTVVPVTETIQPPGTSFQIWMGAELLALQDALGAKAPGH
jgi:zinc/manganese transport system substrate-binding protein